MPLGLPCGVPVLVLPPGPSSPGWLWGVGDTEALALAGRFSQPSLPSATVSVFTKSAGPKNVHKGLNQLSGDLGVGCLPSVRLCLGTRSHYRFMKHLQELVNPFHLLM